MIALPNENIEIRGTCEHPDCDGKPATCLAVGRDGPRMHALGAESAFDFRRVRAYCDAHGEAVSEQGSPEYQVSCSNCGCLEGRN